MAMTMVKRGIAANNEIMNGEGAAGDPEQISLRTFGGGGGGRRRSFVAHEEADFAVKVHSWQRRINEELGTDDVASLGRRRSVAGDEVASPFEAHFGQDLLHSRPDGFPMDDDLLDGRGGVVLRKRKRKKSAASSRGGDGGGRAAPDQRPRPISCCLGVIFRVCPKKSELRCCFTSTILQLFLSQCQNYCPLSFPRTTFSAQKNPGRSASSTRPKKIIPLHC